MKTFTIETETNNITLHLTLEDAQAVPESEHFTSAETLAGLAAEWSYSRLIEIWNGIPGVTPVNKFKDKKTAVTRIWNAIQSLDADVASETATESETQSVTASEPEAQPEDVQTEPATPEPEAGVGEQAPDVAPPQEPSTKKASRKPKMPTGEKVVKAPREASKTSRVIDMLKREGGATLEDIMTEMGWQKHTTRAMLSAGGSLTKNHGLIVTSEMIGDKRTYSIKG
jgi:outer membrane biosynthesis protein TonB